ncbi:MAG: MBL fold metallo-hydrolase [Firmicutes bacterium]|uniref:MBL fold metallo-hydrolase n=1 Tax=Candidatus Scybalomonas excrementavium TaxID=2840943 RepID=A0A9D9N7G8_9FIRM|nr:MBL fold metallo-hydrolase [Candidatus Scybalomonas excrementavium]
MEAIKIYGMPVGNLGANCYFIINEATKDVVCVDTGAQGDTIYELIKTNGWNLCGILLTHGHVDHIGAVSYLKSHIDSLNVYAGKEEQEMLGKPELNLTTMFGKSESLQADYLVEDGQMIQLGGMTFQCIETPGHTKGGICYYLESEKALFTGDTLFAQSVGRSDFPTGDLKALEQSIQMKLYKFPEDTVVYPGHNETTTIGYEKQHNMFVRG